MSSLNRRHFGALVVGSTTGIGALFVTANTSSASVSGSLDIPDENKDVQDSVTAANLDLTGSFQYDSDTKPTRIILRLDVTRGSNTQQLASQVIDTNLKNADTRDYSFNVNLMTHDNLTAADINPTSNGESKSVDLTATVRIHLKADGTMLKETTISEDFTIGATKTTGSTTVTIGGSGNVSITT